MQSKLVGRIRTNNIWRDADGYFITDKNGKIVSEGETKQEALKSLTEEA